MKDIHSPRKYQMDAVNAFHKHFRRHHRGLLVLPCGAGKTYTSLLIKEKLNAYHTLVLVPSLSLVRNFYEEWGHHKTQDYLHYCVCSEKDVDSLEENTPIEELGTQVSTDPKLISDFLSHGGRKTVFCTYQSLPVLSDAVNLSGFQFDLAICDEAHKTTGDVDKHFGLIHNNANFFSKKRLYMTATPRISDPDNPSEETIVDMNDEAVFGKEVYRMSFAQAIEDDVLSDYEIVVVGIDDLNLHQNVLKVLEQNELKKEYAVHNVALDKAMSTFKLNHAFVFHHRIQSSQYFREIHRILYPDIYSEHLDGSHTARERSVVLNRLKTSKKAVVSSARCLSEGVNVPSVDVIYFSDPKHSVIDIVQCVGRAMRKNHSKGKKLAHIIIPVFYSKEKTTQPNFRRQSFKHMIRVIKAMMSHDERLEAGLTHQAMIPQEQWGWKFNGYNRRAFLKLVDFEEGFKLKESLNDALFLQVIARTALNWNVQYEYLKGFKAKYRRDPIYRDEFPKGNELGAWAITQRRKYKNGKLSKDREALLRKIKFSFNPRARKWDQFYDYLVEFKRKYNRFPKMTENFPKGVNIGKWCDTQRAFFKAKRLSKRHIELLQEIDFDFNPIETAWNDKYQLVKEFKEKHDRFPRSNEQIAKDTSLGYWCKSQRAFYNRGQLSDERIQLLQEIGFGFNLYKTAWQDKYQLLKEFKENHDRFPKSDEEYPKGIFLGRWCHVQRVLYHKGKLSENRIRQLKQIDFSFDIQSISDIWTNKYQLLKKFKEKHNRFPKSGEEFPKGTRLGAWCTTQRRYFKQDKLSANRIALLKQIAFDFGSNKDAWDTKYQLLKKFKEKYNRFPKYTETFPEGVRLGPWCTLQRRHFKEGKLSKDRIKKLRGIGFNFNP